jgi:phosphate transport system substrate-binding protein
MISRSTLAIGLAAALLVVPGHAMARTQIPRRRLFDRLSVRDRGCRALRPRQSEVRRPDHRIDRHGRWHEAVLRRRRPAVPDIENASRRIKASEVKQCAQNGVSQITEIQFGLDGIALATAKASPLAGVTQRDVYLALAKTPFGKPNKAKTWKDVNAKLPAIPIRVYGPPPTSGTRDALGELIMTPPCQANPAMAALKKSDEAKFKAICTAVREDGAYVEAGENDNLIVQKIEANSGSIGVFGYSYLEENMDKLRGITINGVAPTYDSIASFKYPGARPLYIYVKNAHVRAIPAIRAYVAEFTRETTWGKGGYLSRRGLISAPDAIRAKSAAAAQAMTPLDPATVK